MAYVRPLNLVRMTFDEGHEWAGLEVVTRGFSTEGMLDLMDLAKSLFEVFGLDEESAKKLGPEDFAGMRQQFAPMLEAFAEVLVSWNLEQEAEEEGAPPVPVPATLRGLLSQDPEFAFGLVMEWFGRVSPGRAGVGDLGKASSSGAQFPEASIPMAPLSPSPVNSNGRN